MLPAQLEGNWLSGHIRRLLEEKNKGAVRGRMGVTSRELSGEMGGDTAIRA